ncbi:MAG: uroporphyrinogen decarboxylase family protein [Chloroflexota bacterium]
MATARQRFLDYVRRVPGARPVVSPFLPKTELLAATLAHLGLPVADDPVANEICLAQALDYEPMFMTDCHGLIFPWREDAARSDARWIVETLDTPLGPWERRISRRYGLFGDQTGFPVKTEADHDRLAAVCAQVGAREAEIHAYFRAWRERVGDGGVIVIGHPHVTWLAYQISQENLVLHARDYPAAFARSMEAIYQAALAVFAIAMQEGIDFMSESGYGREMISPRQFAAEDLPYTRRLADWTHAHGGLMWYHNCGRTRDLIRAGLFDGLGCDVIETIAPPPEGDNDLAESRRWLDGAVCSKGNLSLQLLRDGSPDEVAAATRAMVRAVRGYAHIHSTADAVYAETPIANWLAFLQTARAAADGG